MQSDCSLHVTMLACCHEDEARLRDPWRVRVTRDSPTVYLHGPSPALRRLCPLELVFWASAAQQMAALATLNTPHPARTVLLWPGPHHTSSGLQDTGLGQFKPNLWWNLSKP